MKTWKIVLEYDGSKYRGWQEQNNARTVQGELRQAAENFFGSEVDIQGAGRTDAGVHALAQVAHLRVRIPKTIPPGQILRELNERLPAEIAILSVEPASARFHARHDAVGRSYFYQISTRKNAFAKKHVWWVKEELDVALMSQAARMLVGNHNFLCFRAPDPSRGAESTTVKVSSAVIEQHDDMIVFRIEASHFLWRMVRRIVGVLVKIGLHEIPLNALEKLLKGRCDPALDVAAWTAPASGLFLREVRY